MAAGNGSISFGDFITELPQLHSWDGGATWNTGGFERHHFEGLQDVFLKLPHQPVFLETGAGCSTIAMLLCNPSSVISIAPDKDLFGRIKSYCVEHKIPTHALKVHIERSEWILPILAANNIKSGPIIDFALIDGCHGWPNTFVDLFYVNSILRKGGFLAIDDLVIHSVKEMGRFLDLQSGFELESDLGKSRIYRKVDESTSFGEWNNQAYILAKTKEYMEWSDPNANDRS